MMTILERIARVLCSVDNVPPDTIMDGKPVWQDYLAEAYASLRVMRDPTDEMAEAGRALLSGRRGHKVDEHDVRDLWNAMVDAALSNEG